MTTLLATCSLAQVRIVPEEANVVVGERVFQLLDPHGAEITADDWSVADSSQAEIDIREGRVFVTFNSVGEFTVKATFSGKLAIAHVNVLESSADLQKRVPWVFSPIYESFPNVLHAWAPYPDGASFFYEDRGPSASMIRAIREDGIQLWTWPTAASAEMPKMICGNMSNGVLLSLGKASDTVLVMLDGDGKEMWRHPAPGFNGVRAFTFGGPFFIVEDDPVSASSRVIGLDASTGAQILSVDLPRSRQVLRNLVQTKKGVACSPGGESIGFLPIRHSELQTGVDGISHLSFAVMDLVLDGANCVARQPVSTNAIVLIYSQKLQRLNLRGDGVYTFDLLETNSAEGPASKTPAVVSIPSGDIIPDYTGEGNFIAVRRTAVHWPNMSPALAAEFEYRVSPEGELTDRFPMPPTLREERTVMLLGNENKTGLTARGKIVVAFETATGKVLWKWQALTDDARPLAALADGGVIIQDGPYYLILNDGGTVRTMLPPGFFEFYMHWKVADRQP